MELFLVLLGVLDYIQLFQSAKCYVSLCNQGGRPGQNTILLQRQKENKSLTETRTPEAMKMKRHMSPAFVFNMMNLHNFGAHQMLAY